MTAELNKISTGEKCSPQLIHTPCNILVHYGELALKGGNRGWFEDKLINNIRATLCGLGALKIDSLFGRITIEFADIYPLREITDKLYRVFGVASFAPTYVSGTHLDDIERAVIRSLNGRQIRTFSVRARRVDKGLPYTSTEVNERIGLRVCEFTGLRVNLKNPELTIGVEIMSDRSYIYVDRFKGAGGLPTGTGGRVACLISGGIDSPVAAWRMMKRGCEVDFIHFHSAPFTDFASQEKINEIVDELKKWQCGIGHLVMVPFGDIQKKIVTGVPEKYRVIAYRRFMIRIAQGIARSLHCETLVTGEALGQVASQTLSNIATVNMVADMPVLRPLIGMDKQEIVDLAKEIGTYDLSILPHQDCCQFLEPRHPATKTRPDEFLEVEKALSIEELIREGLTGAEFVDINS